LRLNARKQNFWKDQNMFSFLHRCAKLLYII
jgi:hypothetical protein